MTNKPLSASRIKSLQSCSWAFWCNYHLKLPDSTNDGALRGSLVHSIFECLGKDRHKKHYDKIINDQDAFASPVIGRYIMSYAKENNLTDEFNVNLINEMIVEGLNYDFYGLDNDKSPHEVISEKSFDISVNESGKNYRILGFIDKLFLFKDSAAANIRDFKTSKSFFTGKDYNDNIQGLIYRLAVKHLYPEYYNRIVQFLFLRFDCKEGGEGNIIVPDVDEDELEGFEYYLTEVQRLINNFDESDAIKNFAYDQGYPPKEDGFSGRLTCGYSSYPMQCRKKDDYSPYYYCPYKFPYDYYKLLDESGELIKTSRKKSEIEVLQKHNPGSMIEKEHYNGCPRAYNRNWALEKLKKDGLSEDYIVKYGYTLD